MELTEVLLLQDSEANYKLADPPLLNHYKQLEERILWVDGEIDGSLLEITRQIFLWNIQDRDFEPDIRIPIKIFIFSPGGNLAETMHVCSVIKMSKTPVYTFNMGMAMSGGFLLLAAGHKGHRYTLPYARAMAHSGYGSVGGDFQRAKDAMDDYKAQIFDMQRFIVEHTGITKAQLSKKRDCDWYMSAEQQIKYGVVDGIVTDIGEIIG